MSAETLLLVDDDANVLSVLAGELTRAGYRVETAQSGSEALQKVGVAPPDLVMTAAQMATMSGLELHSRLRETASAEIPVVFLSGPAAVDERRHLAELGVAGCLSEPVYIRDVLALLDGILADRRGPELDVVFRIDPAQLVTALAELSDEVNALLRRIDGKRTLRAAAAEVGFSAEQGLRMARGLRSRGLLIEEAPPLALLPEMAVASTKSTTGKMFPIEVAPAVAADDWRRQTTRGVAQIGEGDVPAYDVAVSLPSLEPEPTLEGVALEDLPPMDLTAPHLITPDPVSGNAISGTLHVVDERPAKKPEALLAAPPPAKKEDKPQKAEKAAEQALEPAAPEPQAVNVVAPSDSQLARAIETAAEEADPPKAGEIADWVDAAQSGPRRQILFVAGLLVGCGVIWGAVDYVWGGEDKATVPDAGAKRVASAKPAPAAAEAPPDAAVRVGSPSLVEDDADAITVVRPVDAPRSIVTKAAAGAKSLPSAGSHAAATGVADFVKQARKAADGGKREQALALLAQALATNPTSGEALTLQANVLLDLGRAAEALAACEKAIRVSDANADAWLTKGMIHLGKDQAGDAKRALQKYLQLRPSGRRAEDVRALLNSL